MRVHGGRRSKYQNCAREIMERRETRMYTSAIEEEGRDSHGETPIPVIILPTRSIG